MICHYLMTHILNLYVLVNYVYSKRFSIEIYSNNKSTSCEWSTIKTNLKT